MNELLGLNEWLPEIVQKLVQMHCNYEGRKDG